MSKKDSTAVQKPAEGAEGASRGADTSAAPLGAAAPESEDAGSIATENVGDITEETLPPVVDQDEHPAHATLRDILEAKAAAIKVTMLTPESGANNPHTVFPQAIPRSSVPGATYEGAVGGEVEVAAHHVEDLLNAGWTAVSADWAARVIEANKLREEIDMLPDWLQAQTLEEASAMFDRWFN